MAEISLEARSNKIEVVRPHTRSLLKIVRIGGYVTKVEGGRKDNTHESHMRIYLNPETQRDNITQLNFYGTSPVRSGDKIAAGIILDEEVRTGGKAGEAFYVEIIDQRGNYLRRDFMNNCGTGWFNRDLGLQD
jgi:hypothetical protein